MTDKQFSSLHTHDFLHEIFFPVDVTPRDRFSFYYVAGFLFGTLDAEDGMHVEVVRHYITSPNFEKFEHFDKRSLSKDKRNELIVQLCNGGVPQERVARYFEIGQSTVSMILRKMSTKEE